MRQWNRWTLAAMATLVAAALIGSLAVARNAPETQTEAFEIVGVGVGPDGIPFPGQPARPH